MHFDLLFVNGSFFSAPYCKFIDGWVGVIGEKIAALGKGKPFPEVTAERIIDLEGAQLVPGLIDIHTHIESALITPGAFAEALVSHGVTTIVSEPHEIANVAGAEGVLAMIEAGADAPMDIYYGIPSSVPASSSELETTGGEINEKEIAELVSNPMVRCLGEVMNAKSVVTEPDGKANRIVREFKKDAPLLPVEGHCPRLFDLDLCKFVYAGIDSDHTEHDVFRFSQRWLNGMLVELQEKTLEPDIIAYMVEKGLSWRTAIVTDDQMANTLATDGALDRLVRYAIKNGFPRDDAIRSATAIPADRMLLRDRGEIKPGLLADLVIIKNNDSFDPVAVYKNGELKWDTSVKLDPERTFEFPDKYSDSLVLPREFTEDDFTVKADGDVKTVKTMHVAPERTAYKAGTTEMKVINGELAWENSGYLLTSVTERYTGKMTTGYGFLCGSCHKSGAICSTYSHDNHSVLVSGTNKRDMVIAANRVRELHGGIVVVNDGEIIAELALPAGGIMSTGSAAYVGENLGKVVDAMRALGYVHPSPIMSLCVASLTVSPELKVTDKGMIDVLEQKIVPLFE
ncbi:MAG: adenine deaminase [Oscillospiraceae bacterium]|nr:adenine deaminase [Oscillospiraceae bacterium]